MGNSKYSLCWLGIERKIGVCLNRAALWEPISQSLSFRSVPGSSGTCGCYMVLYTQPEELFGFLWESTSVF